MAGSSALPHNVNQQKTNGSGSSNNNNMLLPHLPLPCLPADNQEEASALCLRLFDTENNSRTPETREILLVHPTFQLRERPQGSAFQTFQRRIQEEVVVPPLTATHLAGPPALASTRIPRFASRPVARLATFSAASPSPAWSSRRKHPILLLDEESEETTADYNSGGEDELWSEFHDSHHHHHYHHHYDPSSREIRHVGAEAEVVQTLAIPDDLDDMGDVDSRQQRVRVRPTLRPRRLKRPRLEQLQGQPPTLLLSLSE
mmetsp:Transcript_7126/g.14617  ORF Transcript_7126/g.14617 Transcript_7126/m.14617 type:complete len:259 (+) Transcript_7126:198-974(+)|eukprot:CAMPEP_0168740052 /NCGR_PEP_ID=MMETSP0724-20121128/11777_1 /TAXON_ID=265536 /ORGANISM="Amphiprora sp., Strain CCMP467" /LENGTH=258 /DNA_ID=CAMNT_0008787469 /DNA_START=100 /DNA_END=876 /DNA_ORIENTATION=+